MARTTPTFVSHVTASSLRLVHKPLFTSRANPVTPTNTPHKRRRAPCIRSCNDSPNSKSDRASASPTSRGPVPNPSAGNGASRANADRNDFDSRTEEPPSSTNGNDLHSKPPQQDSALSPRPDNISISLGLFSGSIPSRWLLYSVPFLWGSFGPAVRLLFSQDTHPDPSIFNTERLLLSTLVYVPVLVAEFAAFRKRDTTAADPDKSFRFVTAGAELGLYVFFANVAQVIGLQQTSASRAAFLVQLQTVIVPVLSGIFGLDKISPKTWFSSLVAVAGVALLSSDKGHGTVSSFTGDALEVLSAVFFSMYIIRLGRYCNEVPANPLVATKIAVQAVLSIAWAALSGIGIFLHHVPTQVTGGAEDTVSWTLMAVLVNLGVVMWTGLMSSAASGWAQTRGQQGVPASEAVVIFATQPLWASAIAAIVLGESFGAKGFAGGAMIVAATLIAGQSDDGKEGTEEG